MKRFKAIKNSLRNHLLNSPMRCRLNNTTMSCPITILTRAPNSIDTSISKFSIEFQNINRMAMFQSRLPTFPAQKSFRSLSYLIFIWTTSPLIRHMIESTKFSVRHYIITHRMQVSSPAVRPQFTECFKYKHW